MAIRMIERFFLVTAAGPSRIRTGVPCQLNRQRAYSTTDITILHQTPVMYKIPRHCQVGPTQCEQDAWEPPVSPAPTVAESAVGI